MCSVTKGDDGVVVIQPRNLDSLTDDGFKETTHRLLKESGWRAATICLRYLSHADSTGLGDVLNFYKAACKIGKPVNLARMPGQAQDLFERLGYDKIIESYASIDQAKGAHPV